MPDMLFTMFVYLGEKNNKACHEQLTHLADQDVVGVDVAC